MIPSNIVSTLLGSYSNSAPDFSRKITFTANQSWTVPSDNSGKIRVKAWGAAGGRYLIGTSGGGGFAQADVNVTPNSTLLISVGSGGLSRSSTSAGNGAGVPINGSSGGGYSGVFTNNTASQANALVIAGGGGGATGGGTAGAGGGSSGGSGNAGGGTQIAGGSAYSSGTAGSALKGGNATASTNSSGGGGYFGGGASGASGGGSGFVHPTAMNSVLTTGSGATVANSADADYVAGKGNGSAADAAGQPGYVVIYY